MPAVQVTNLKKHFGSIKAVDDISFSMEKGEVFGFLGPNGAGKTTTIRCMMDFVRPTSGSIAMFGKDARTDSVALKAKVGYLPSDIHLYDSWTGREHIRFVERAHGKKVDARSLIDAFQFEAERKVKHLSTGNKQKLAIILALITEPELLILDEPTRGLDPLLQNTLYDLLRKFRERGGTIFMSSHNLAEVEHLCDRVGIIKNGKLIAVESLDDLKGKQIHVVTVTFQTPIPRAAFVLPCITISSEHTNGYTLKVRGEIGPFLKTLAQYPVTDLEVTHASLEEAFLEMYDGEKEEGSPAKPDPAPPESKKE